MVSERAGLGRRLDQTVRERGDLAKTGDLASWSDVTIPTISNGGFTLTLLHPIELPMPETTTSLLDLNVRADGAGLREAAVRPSYAHPRIVHRARKPEPCDRYTS